MIASGDSERRSAAAPPDASAPEFSGPGGRRGPVKAASAVITNAQPGASREMDGRVKRYAITMAFRTACFISMIFVPGVFRWVLFACAVFLPYVAVIAANQANKKSDTPYASVTMGGPLGNAPALPPGRSAYADEDEVISGDVADPPSDGRAA